MWRLKRDYLFRLELYHASQIATTPLGRNQAVDGVTSDLALYHTEEQGMTWSVAAHSRRREVVKVARDAKALVELLLGTGPSELFQAPGTCSKHVVRPAIGSVSCSLR